MKYLITGATGFVGQQLCLNLLGAGHSVNGLSRNPEKAKKKLPNVSWFQWNDDTCFDGIDGVAHLAGENLFSGFWTEKKKQQILESRSEGTKKLVKGILKTGRASEIAFVSTSAIGFYGQNSTKVTFTEKSPQGEGFLATVCRAWERPVQESSLPEWWILRVGLVLGEQGGLLKMLAPSFRIGLGAKLGDGQQGMSWIHLQDLCHIYQSALERKLPAGIYNACVPTPCSQELFSETLADVLNKPLWLKIPKFPLKKLGGEQAKTLYLGQYVEPKHLLEQKFTFLFPELKTSLQDLLK